MSDLNLFHGPNAGYILEQYERYQQDPASIDPEMRAFLATLSISTLTTNPTALSSASSLPVAAPSPGTDTEELVRVAAATARLARFIRQRGHLAADLDPLHIAPLHDADLELSEHNLTPEDVSALPASVIGGLLAETSANALEVIGKLRTAYSGSIGFDDEHIQNAEERYWLRDAAESEEYVHALDKETRCDLLQRLTEVDTFEQFIHRTFQGQKRFSIEGTDMLVPILDEIVHQAAVLRTKEVVLGMAHRGRLSVLAHVLGKPYSMILSGFSDPKKTANIAVAEKGNRGYSGDVKYHLGFRRRYQESNVAEMPITLVPNPSHLEFVNPVVEGHTRAAQDQRSRPGAPFQDDKAALAILIHGDAAFPGQGIVPETLNLSSLPGYNTGGTIHIIANNQVGFTTLPSDGRSTTYASDLAKGFEIPIVHVNADDVEACIAVARIAHAYRAKFHKDFLIDLIGYRRYGHNESDEAAFTQPRMYAIIEKHPRVRDQWAKKLKAEGVVTQAEDEAMVKSVREKLQAALEETRATPKPALKNESDTGVRNPRTRVVETNVPAERLKELNDALLVRPDGFTTAVKLETGRGVFAKRRTGMMTPGGIEWGHAESLAFASILAEGTPIRLSGQDTERGTFSQRQAVLHDPTTGDRYCPLQGIPQARASFAIYNSPLSENACIGFEYGYSIHAPGVLVLWEGQFGDFVNGAQVIIDQFIASGHAKWQQIPSLILLLPHGYEGSGPEHSSARLERFLQLAANDNLRIANCTTSAQYFHLLRRQAALLETDPRPLIVMTPKGLLRHPGAASSLSDLAEGVFQPVIDDLKAREHANQVTRLVLCSGKVYIDLVFESPQQSRLDFAEAKHVAAVRVEELYPFPSEEIQQVIAGYPNLREVVWLQEEPGNMGAWSFVEPRLRDLLAGRYSLHYTGRPEAASTAEGSPLRHEAEQNRIIGEALANVPEPLRERLSVR